MRVAIGLVTFGNLDFTKLCIRGIEETVSGPYRICAVVGKPGDVQTDNYFSTSGIYHILHNRNYGFPFSINDIYDIVFKGWEYDALVFIGNDVIPYPNAINYLIKAAKESDNDWLCSQEFDVRNLCDNYPEARKYFSGEDYTFTSFDERPWEMFSPNQEYRLDAGGGMSDTHNLAIYKRSFFDKIGYIDTNYYPAYYSDNDMARRAINIGTVKSAKVLGSYYFHFWSRTIKQGSGGSTHKFFNMNRDYYKDKWGGDFLSEKYTIPFDGKEYKINGRVQTTDLNISTRENDLSNVTYWMSKR